DEFQTSGLAVGLYDWVVAFDHACERAWMISTGFPEQEPECRRRRAEKRLVEVRRRLEAAPADVGWTPAARRADVAGQSPGRGIPGLTSSLDGAEYLAAVRRAIEYVHAGDCFQVNLAQRLLYPADVAPLELYERLRQRNAATFAAYFDLGQFAIASASPERFLRVERG